MTPEDNQPINGFEETPDRAAGGKRPSTGRPIPAKRTAGRKISRRLVIASAAAILSVYTAGYALTAPAAAQIAAQTASVTNVQNSPSIGSTTITGTTSTASPTVATSGYKDGTYTGLGTSRHGDIQAQVVVQNGKIVSAQILQASTRYPVSRIASLPGEVVAQQSTNVDLVSGATDSSTAYLAAVTNALAQAS